MGVAGYVEEGSRNLIEKRYKIRSRLHNCLFYGSIKDAAKSESYIKRTFRLLFLQKRAGRDY
jgi:hypothetical protein